MTELNRLQLGGFRNFHNPSFLPNYHPVSTSHFPGAMSCAPTIRTTVYLMDRVEYDGWSGRFRGSFRFSGVSAALRAIFCGFCILLVMMISSRFRRTVDPGLPLGDPSRAFATPLPQLMPVPPYARRIGEKPWQRAVPPNFKIATEFGAFCVLCGPQYRNSSANSSDRDLIMSVMMTQHPNAVTFIRTLRSTGCKAAVIIFVDYPILQSFTAEHLRLYDDCGVVFLDVGHIQEGFKNHLFEYRHLFYYEFLMEYRSKFDRVITVDMADTIFQQDPFTTDFGYYTMGATSEVVKLNADPDNNTAWIKIADPDYAIDPNYYADRWAVNAGFVFGSTEAMLIYYNVLLKQKIYEEFTPATIDQGYINFLYHKRVFDNAGLKVKITYPGDYLVSVRGATFERDVTAQGLFKMAGRSGLPAAIHQYNRICPITNWTKTFCPAMPYDSVPYAVVKDVTQPCD